MGCLLYCAYEGHRFAVRKITEDVYNAAEKGQLPPLPYAQFRIPIAAGLYIMFAILGFTMRSASSGERSMYYPSGEKQASGLLVDGKESGPWQLWWDSGNPMSKGLLINGRADSTWEFYSDAGKLYRELRIKVARSTGYGLNYMRMEQ